MRSMCRQRRGRRWTHRGFLTGVIMPVDVVAGLIAVGRLGAVADKLAVGGDSTF